MAASVQEPPELLASTGFLLARIGSESAKRFTRALVAEGLRLSHFSVLMTLANGGPASQRALGQAIGMDPRNLVSVIDSLEAQGLVKRQPDKADRRRHGLALTEDGRRALSRVRELSVAHEKDMLSGLNKGEQTLLRELLIRILPAAASKSGEGED